jgi:endopeptidase La
MTITRGFSKLFGSLTKVDATYLELLLLKRIKVILRTFVNIDDKTEILKFLEIKKKEIEYNRFCVAYLFSTNTYHTITEQLMKKYGISKPDFYLEELTKKFISTLVTAVKRKNYTFSRYLDIKKKMFQNLMVHEKTIFTSKDDDSFICNSEDEYTEEADDDSDSDYTLSESDDDEDSDDDLDDKTDESLHRKLIQNLKKKKASSELLEFADLLYKAKAPSIMLTFESFNKTQKEKILAELRNLQNTDLYQPIIFRILLADMPDKVRIEILRKFENSKKDEAKYNMWLDSVLRIPFNKYSKPLPTSKVQEFITSAEQVMEKAVYGHSKPKHKIVQYLCQIISNPKSIGMVLGIKGPMGNGKTTLIEKGLSKVLHRPFHCIPLGGATDSSFLNGHSFTYEGSTWGQIADVLMKSNVMDPVIYFDELDKVSNTPKGEEIINLLIHLIDPSQNTHFQDRFFGNIDIDLSKVTFVFSYNDESRINPILLDRIFQVETDGFNTKEKIVIAKQYLIPNIVSDVGIKKNHIEISDETLSNMIEKYTNEAGVRKLRELLYEIVRERNVELLKSKVKKPVELDYQTIKSKYISSSTEFTISKIHENHTIGKINGLYATNGGQGGILPIESQWIPGDQTLGLQVTGNLGKVMTESVSVAKTVAWNNVSDDIKKYWFTTWKDYKTSIHIHCEEMGIEKEGPSAGCALTLCMISLLTNKPILKNVGITGEINLSGDVLEIGGLKEKLRGAKRAGCTLCIIPFNNLKHLDKIIAEEPDLIQKNIFDVIPVKHVKEVLDKVFEEDTEHNKRLNNKKRKLTNPIKKNT